MKLAFGEKIKALRLACDLTQEELANRADLSKGFISQLENGQTSIQIDYLADILEVLGVSLSEFFSEKDDDRKVVYAPEERVSIEGTGAGSFELLVPGSTNNVMDPILVRLEPGEKLDKTDPHPGEQFGFVLSGTATLLLGQRTYKVPKQHCFYFESDLPHQIRNESKRPVSLLRIVSPPQM
ncbi:MAG TPA: XRE family transcriptional regulator [candidate division Zixibacteria bacterium]|nr:XRE family transcriptional regulator [candidate division Zixibacteria bacterium]